MAIGLRKVPGTGVRVGTIDPGMAETEFSMVRFKGDEQRSNKVYEGVVPLTAIDIAEKKTLDLKTTISNTEGADLADAILELQTGQTARQAALQAKGQEDRRTLFDFIR